MDGFKTVIENVYKEGIMWLQGMRNGNLYVFDLNCSKGANISLTAQKNQFNLWHLRLGHLNVSDVQKLSSMLMVFV